MKMDMMQAGQGWPGSQDLAQSQQLWEQQLLLVV